jgi:hypothetical protein
MASRQLFARGKNVVVYRQRNRCYIRQNTEETTVCKQRRRVSIALAIIAGLMLLAAPAMAKATRTEFSGIWTVTEFGDPAKWWFPGGGWQARGWPLIAHFEADCDLVDGRWVHLFDNHFDAEAAGPWNGTFHADISCGDEPGAWDGSFTGTSFGYIAGAGGTAYLRGHGSGCVEGMKIFLDMVNSGPGGTLTYTGYILDPHGE